MIEEGEVYTGWKKEDGDLDANYAEQAVMLTSRDILRTWAEVRRRGTVLTLREAVREAMSEMDEVLNELGLPDAQMQLVQVPDGYLAVAVLKDRGSEETA